MMRRWEMLEISIETANPRDEGTKIVTERNIKSGGTAEADRRMRKKKKK